MPGVGLTDGRPVIALDNSLGDGVAGETSDVMDDLITMTLGFDLEHGKSILLIEERDPFDQARQAFSYRVRGWRLIVQSVQFWSGLAMETSGSCIWKHPAPYNTDANCLAMQQGVSKHFNICYPSNMDIDLTGFSATQHKALFDLLILAMYADGHVTTFEDKQLQELLAAMGFTEKTERQREFDAAVARIRPSIQTVWKAKAEALSLAEPFTDRNQRKQVFSAVEQIMTFDNHVSNWENILLMELRMTFRL